MIKSMRPDELHAKITAKDEFTLIDCREKGEWDEGHINEAIFMPMSNFQEEAKKLDNKDAAIVIQCRTGRRSMGMCQFLEAQGYTDITNLEGGIMEWMDDGYEVKK